MRITPMMRPNALPVEGTIYQIGVVVADLEQAMGHYSQLFGLGDWKRLDTDYSGRYRDWEGRIANRNAFAQWGAIHLELVEPGIGEGNAKEWLRTRGPGMFHVGVIVDDVRNHPPEFEVVFESRARTQPDGSPAIVHLDTVASLGFFVELAWRPMAEGLIERVAAPGPWA